MPHDFPVRLWVRSSHKFSRERRPPSSKIDLALFSCNPPERLIWITDGELHAYARFAVRKKDVAGGQGTPLLRSLHVALHPDLAVGPRAPGVAQRQEEKDERPGDAEDARPKCRCHAVALLTSCLHHRRLPALEGPLAPVWFF